LNLSKLVTLFWCAKTGVLWFDYFASARRCLTIENPASNRQAGYHFLCYYTIEVPFKIILLPLVSRPCLENVTAKRKYG